MTETTQKTDVWSLLCISLPLMLSFLSGMAMIFVDRFFLAQYAESALAAAVSAGTLAWGFSVGLSQLTGIGAVFVAQYQGAGKLQRLGRPIWQMLWLCLALLPLFALLGTVAAPYLFPQSEIYAQQVLYFRAMMVLSPLFCIFSALSGFYIGRGQTRLLTVMVILGNVLNVLLDPICIFGWGSLRGTGILGACVATGISLCLQIVVLGAAFVSREHRQAFGTGDWTLRPGLLWTSVRVGAPEALALGLEIAAWGVFYSLFAQLGQDHILVISVTQTLILLFLWFGIGLQHGVSSIGGHLIGAGRALEVYRLLWSVLRILVVFGVLLGLVFWTCGARMIELFLLESPSIELAKVLGSGLTVAWVFILTESLRMAVYGALRAAGDTLYLFFMQSLAIWFLLLVPTYLMVQNWNLPISAAYAIWVTYSVATLGLALGRFWWGAWRRRRALAET